MNHLSFEQFPPFWLYTVSRLKVLLRTVGAFCLVTLQVLVGSISMPCFDPRPIVKRLSWKWKPYLRFVVVMAIGCSFGH